MNVERRLKNYDQFWSFFASFSNEFLVWGELSQQCFNKCKSKGQITVHVISKVSSDNT